VTQNLEIISKKFQFSTRSTRIIIGFIISTIYDVVLIANPMGRNVVRLFRTNLEILVTPYLQLVVLAVDPLRNIDTLTLVLTIVF